MTSDLRSGDYPVPVEISTVQDGSTPNARSDGHVIDWAPPSLEGVVSIHRPDPAFMHRTWRRWMLAVTLLVVLGGMLLYQMSASALLRLNTSVSIESPPRMSVELSPSRANAFGKSPNERSDDWANEYQRAVARERADELKQLVETLRERRAGKEGSEVVKNSLDQGLSHVLVDLQHALANGQLGSARDAAIRGGAMLEAADLEPPFNDTDLVVKVNAVLMARALLDDKQLARDMTRLHALMQLVLQKAPDLAPSKEQLAQVDRKRDAWDTYMEGKQALTQHDYAQAILRFHECAEGRSNPWLRDLALLGEGRAHYWQARSTATKGTTKQALNRLRVIEAEILSLSLRNDIGFYVDDLQERRP